NLASRAQGDRQAAESEANKASRANRDSAARTTTVTETVEGPAPSPETKTLEPSESPERETVTTTVVEQYTDTVVVVSTTVSVYCSTTVVVTVSRSGDSLGSRVLVSGDGAGTSTVSVTVVVRAAESRLAREALLALLSAACLSPWARYARFRASSSSARVHAKSPEAAAASSTYNVLASSTKASSEELNRL